MPTSISIRFLTGRAHLHHWQAHHSDGKGDWPPSPWRLLRALIAAAGSGLTTLPGPMVPSLADTEGDAVPLSRLTSLLAALSSPPEIWLPRTGGGHTRQYFPIHESHTVKPSGSAVFDTFACVSKDTPIHFHWPSVSLEPEKTSDLAKILRRVTYFGRAESWCEASVSTAELKRGETHWCCVCIDDGGKPDGREHAEYTLERKLAPLLPLDSGLRTQTAELMPKCGFRVWERARRPKPGHPEGKWRGAKPQELSQFKTLLADESESCSLVRCLLRATGEDMKEGLERPIGTRWVHYAVPRAIYQLPARRPRRVKPAEPSITLIRFTLNTATVNRPVLPQLTDTLLVADKLRAAALAWHDHVARDFPEAQRHPRNLCGREADNSRIKGHDHAFFWPTDDDNDGFIDHVSVFCPSGLLAVEVEALRRLLRLKQRGGRPDLLMTPVFLGEAENFEPWRGNTRTFISATPYFCPVHLGHGNKSGGAIRSVTGEIRSSLLLTRVVESEAELVRVAELVFPVSSSEFAPGQSRDNGRQETAVSAGRPLAPPAGATKESGLPDNPRYIGGLLKAPDEALTPGFATGLCVENGSRFIRALAFCRKRRGHVVDGKGRMFLLEFATPRAARPFSIGSQAHFGLGMFVPVD